ncbi:dynein heavy chain, partial [Linderina pennispora]
MFSFPDASAKCKSFANDPTIPVLYVIKETESDGGEDADAEMAGYSFSTSTYTLSYELSWRPSHVGSIALIKRVTTLNPSQPLAKQIQVMNLPGPASTGSAGSVAAPAATEAAAAPAAESEEASKERAAAAVASGLNPYEALHAYIHFAVTPYFNAYVTAKEKAEQQASAGGEAGSGAFREDKDSQPGIPMAKKKLAELELSLLHLQQNMEIPEIVLSIHPVIVRAVEDCRSKGERVTVDAIDPALLSDSGFLNQLQGDVNGWIKEIQKVTKLDRDPASGTTSQEINFW